MTRPEFLDQDDMGLAHPTGEGESVDVRTITPLESIEALIDKQSVRSGLRTISLALHGMYTELLWNSCETVDEYRRTDARCEYPNPLDLPRVKNETKNDITLIKPQIVALGKLQSIVRGSRKTE